MKFPETSVSPRGRTATPTHTSPPPPTPRFCRHRWRSPLRSRTAPTPGEPARGEPRGPAPLPARRRLSPAAAMAGRRRGAAPRSARAAGGWGSAPRRCHGLPPHPLPTPPPPPPRCGSSRKPHLKGVPHARHELPGFHRGLRAASPCRGRSIRRGTPAARPGARRRAERPALKVRLSPPSCSPPAPEPPPGSRRYLRAPARLEAERQRSRLLAPCLHDSKCLWDGIYDFRYAILCVLTQDEPFSPAVALAGTESRCLPSGEGADTRSAEPHSLGVRAEGTGFNNPGMGSFPKRIKYLISIQILTLVLKFEGLHNLDRYYLTILIK